MTGGADSPSVGEREPPGSTSRGGAPPLPPSPLARVPAAAPVRESALPWTTVVAALVPPLALSVVTSPLGLSPSPGQYTALTAEPWRAAFMVLGAAIMDRVAPSWARGLRWGIGMAVGGLVPPEGLLLCPGTRCGLPVGDWTTAWALTVLGSGLVGLLLGLAMGRGSRPAATRLVMAVVAGAGVQGLWLVVIQGLYIVSPLALRVGSPWAVAATVARAATVGAVVPAAHGAAFSLVVVAGVLCARRVP